MSQSQQTGRIADFAMRLADPLAIRLYKVNITPDRLFTAGILSAVVGVACVAYQQLFWAGIFYLISGICDLLSSSMARMIGSGSRFALFIGRVLDRVAEGLMYAAITYYYGVTGPDLMVGVSAVVMLNVYLVDLMNASTVMWQLPVHRELLTRIERLLLIIGGLLLNIIGLVIFALFFVSTIVVLQKIIHIGNTLRDE